ncbi:Down syndrome cell adhesion molecule-like protein Dscam2, partial [Leptotrombidium deliense]
QTVFANGTLSIQNVFRSEDEGEYKCVVKDEDDESFERNVHIKVIVAPAIAAFNLVGTLQEGMRASITCTVTTGDPPVTMRWFKDGKQLKASDDLLLENVDDFISNLIFKPLKQKHSGVYACVATNEAASVNHSVSLSVDAPPKWKIEPNDQSAIVGHSLTVDCQANGKPEPRVLWKKMSGKSKHENYKTVISGSRVQTLVNGSLHFLAITANDSGLYLCEASNGIGVPITAVIRITVNVPAHFAEKYDSLKIRKEEKIELNCKAFGESPLKIVWSKDGQRLEKVLQQFDIQEEASNKELTSKLILAKVTRTDSEKPDTPSALKIMNVNSRSVQVKWTKPFDGNIPIAKYTLQYKEANDVWERNGKELLVDGTRIDTFIMNLLPVTLYQLRIRAENELGKSDWSDVLSVTTDEEVPETVPRNIQHSSSFLIVYSQFPLLKHQQSKIAGFYVGYKKFRSQESFVFKTVKSGTQEIHYSTELNGLTKMTKYVIVLQAFNGKGGGPLSEELFAETAEFDAPSAPNVKIASVSATAIELSWNPTADEENPIYGYVILHRKEVEQNWHEIQLMSDITFYSLSSMQCGTTYLIAVLAFNTIGRGKQSETLSVKTRGTVPVAPEKESLIAVNSSFVVLHLDSWIDNECRIESFSIQYKAQHENTFIRLLDDSYLPDKTVTIRNLEAATYYNIWISARNGAGITEAQYKIATLTESGGE